jgi:uncharacterized membrane protein
VDRSAVYGISDDGKTIVGSIPGVSRNKPASWTRETGFVALESLSVPVDQGMATAASSDGSVIVGQANLPTNGGAFRWTATEGLVGLGLGDVSVAQDVSANGLVIVGRMHGPETEPLMHVFRWTTSAGVEDVATFGAGGEVTATNGDATAIVGGFSATSGSAFVPYLWTLNPGLVPLGSETGEAVGISFDGTKVGCFLTGSPSRAAVYTSTAGLSDLPLDGLTNVRLSAMSGDAELFAGSSSEGVWLWDAENGTRMFQETFEALGADLTGWTSISVNAISRDGRVLAGDGYRDNVYNTWLARL